MPDVFEAGAAAISGSLLLQGSPPATERALARLSAPPARATVCRRCGEALTLDANPGSTVIFQDVDTLTETDQRSLKLWLERLPAGTRIVSTARASLYSLVERGLFDAELYYRLNVVMLSVD
jgi:hypothetical protein